MQDQAQNPEDQIVDQIGELMQQLPPEKQAAVIQKLQELVEGPAQEAPQLEQTVSPEGGPNGKPAGF